MIEKDLICKEDINFGVATVQRRSQTGSLIPLTQVNAGHIPIVDSGGNFTGTTVEAALAETLTQVGAGSSAADYLNNSGSDRVVGDVVVISSTADKAFTTTTSVGSTSVLGVVGEAIAAGAVGKVITGGYCPALKVTGVTSRGSFLRTSTTAGQAVSLSTSAQGVFAVALTATGGAGTVEAFVFGVVGQDFLPTTGGNLTGTLGLYKGNDVTSASALNPWASSNVGNYFDITGTNTITSIATSGNVGTWLLLHFDAQLTLTHHATNLILPGGVNLVTGAGDELLFVEYASGQWRCFGFLDASTTGTGHMVRNTDATLIRPIIDNPDLDTDTIEEFSTGVGVTVDSVLLKDGLVQSESVRDTSVDFDNAGGLMQWVGVWVADAATTYSDAGGSPPSDYSGLTAIRIYVPTNATTLEAYVYARRGGGSSDGARVALNNGTSDGTFTSRVTSGTLAWYLTSVDVSGLSGWADIKFRCEASGTPGDTFVITRIMFRFQ